MGGLSSYFFPIFYFLMPLLAGLVISIAGAAIAGRLMGRFKGPSAIASAAAVFVVISNVAFLGLNASLGTSPLGPVDSWRNLWIFAFAPISLISAVVLAKYLDRIHENDPRAG